MNSKYIIRKIFSSIVLIILITMLVFTMMHMQAGNPYIDRLGANVSGEQFEQMLIKLGYYDPIWIKYLKWIKQLVSGDMGISIKHGQEVSKLIRSNLSNSLVLISISFAISSVVGVFVGVQVGKSKNIVKKLIKSSSVVLLSMPSFFISILLIKYFSYDLKILPSSGMYSLKLLESVSNYEIFIDRLRHSILPITVLVFMNTPIVTQFVIVNMEKELESDYVKTAKAKGLSQVVIVWKHVLKNISIPLIVILSAQAPMIFSGAMITETIFNYPGMGKLGFDAVLARDYPLVMGILLVNTIVVVVVNFTADLIYVILDPRIQLEKEGI